jgi:hypothetical protein
LHRYKKQRSIPVAYPCSGIGSCHKSGGFFLGEILDRTVFKALRWDCKNALTLQAQRWLADCHESEEGVHGC